MAQQGYKILIMKNGGIKIEAEGFVGEACQVDLKKLQKQLEELGVSGCIVDQQKKSEMYAAPATEKQVCQY